MLCGEYNGRISDQCNFTHTVIAMRALDTGRNSHGDSSLDFSKDCKVCLLNGRVTPEYDN